MEEDREFPASSRPLIRIFGLTFFPYTGSANLESYLYHPFFVSLLCFISRLIRKCFPTAISIISSNPDAAFAFALELAPFRLFVYFDPLYSLGRSDPIYITSPVEAILSQKYFYCFYRYLYARFAIKTLYIENCHTYKMKFINFSKSV